MTNKNDTTVWKGSRGLWTTLPIATSHQTRYTTMRPQILYNPPCSTLTRSSTILPCNNIILSASHKSPCSTTSTRRLHTTRQHQPVNFTQPAVRLLRQPSRCTNSISTTTNNNIPWDSDTHMYIRLISPKSVGVSIHRLLSFHPVHT